MKKVKVTRSAQTTYTFLPERFCTFCGAKGIYEDDVEDYYQGNSEFCFHCTNARPHELRDPESFGKLVGREPIVVDRKEWEAEITEFEHLLDKHMSLMGAKLAEDVLKPVPNLFWDGPGTHIPIRYGPKGDE